jgi:hypothetical protein
MKLTVYKSLLLESTFLLITTGMCVMFKEDKDSAELAALIRFKTALHTWELDNLSHMQTTTGRHIYHVIAQKAIAEQSPLDHSLKNLFTSPHFTERALRNRMQEMMEQGFLITHQSNSDGRNKHLTPTDVLNQDVLKHAEQTRRLLREAFLLIKR